jgi:hypothetical protein
VGGVGEERDVGHGTDSVNLYSIEGQMAGLSTLQAGSTVSSFAHACSMRQRSNQRQP